LKITMFEINRLYTTNYVLNAYCIISVGIGGDASTHDQRTKTRCVRGQADQQLRRGTSKRYSCSQLNLDDARLISNYSTNWFKRQGSLFKRKRNSVEN